jgi:hypothetical protein
VVPLFLTILPPQRGHPLDLICTIIAARAAPNSTPPVMPSVSFSVLFIFQIIDPLPGRLPAKGG